MHAYLDNSATTRPCREVRELAIDLMDGGWYNPSALYKPALEIQKQMDRCRADCLKAAGADGQRVVFTSGGTEADNLALLGHLRTRRPGGRVLISSVEHPAVFACADEIERMGFRVEEIPVSSDGRIDTAQMEKMLDESVTMIAVMQVNNETGAAEPLQEIAELRKRICPEAAFHVDGIQGFLRMPVLFNRLGLQSYALSAHKIHGLKGTGALIIRKDHSVKPVQWGGGQEGNLRSGTENTLGILALGAAVRAYDTGNNERMRNLKQLLWDRISAAVPEAVRIGAGEEHSAPHILNVSLFPVRSQTMLFALEGDGIYVSAGSACASRKQKISPVLKAMGIPTERADCALRFSLSPETTQEEIEYTAQRTAVHWQLLKKYIRR